MMLDFHGFDYDQETIAEHLPVKSRTNPNGPLGVDLGRERELLTAIKKLTKGALKAHMHDELDDKPGFWKEFVTEIGKNRPVIRMQPSHYVAIAGYSKQFDGTRELMIYDPAQNNASWETCDKEDCRDCQDILRCKMLFSARLKKS